MDLTKLVTLFNTIKTALGKYIIGQEHNIEMLLVALLAEGHILIEGVPGTGKTLTVKMLSRVLDFQYNRIQLTPDMLPSDITGNSIYDLNTKQFYLRKGPVFTDILLADEINRTPPKTQSALLEAMEEKQITLDGKQEKMSSLFTVIATQNPVEFEGTYPLPEAQLDRFMLKLIFNYPDKQSEIDMLRIYQDGYWLHKFDSLDLHPVASQQDVLECRHFIKNIVVEDSILEYIVEIIRKTRDAGDITLGASTRAGISILNASKSYAALMGQEFVTPDHIKHITKHALRHRLILSPESEFEGLQVDEAISIILTQVKVPR